MSSDALREAVLRVTFVGPEHPNRPGLDPRSYTVHRLDSHFADDPCAVCAALAATPAKSEPKPLPEDACGVMGLCERRRGHEGKHETSVDRALATPAAEGLDAAWKAAEAALPEGWTLGVVKHPERFAEQLGQPRAEAWDTDRGFGPGTSATAHGPTPAAALHALAARLAADAATPSPE